TETCDTVLDLIRQAVVRTIHAAEVGVTSFRRNFQRIKDARLRRILDIRHVRVPNGFAGTEAPNRFPIFDDVRDNIDFRVAFHKAASTLLDRRFVEFTEAATESNQIVVAQLLPSKQQDLMIEPRPVNGFELIRVNSSEVYAVNLGAERLFSW